MYRASRRCRTQVSARRAAVCRHLERMEGGAQNFLQSMQQSAGTGSGSAEHNLQGKLPPFPSRLLRASPRGRAVRCSRAPTRSSRRPHARAVRETPALRFHAPAANRAIAPAVRPSGPLALTSYVAFRRSVLRCRAPSRPQLGAESPWLAGAGAPRAQAPPASASTGAPISAQPPRSERVA